MRRVAPSVSIDRIAYAAVALFVLVVTWNGFRLGGGAVANAFMVLAFLAFIARVLTTRQPVPVPPWLVAAGGGFVLAAMLNIIFPPDAHLINLTLLSYRILPQGAIPGYLVPRSDLLELATFLLAFLVIPVMIASVANTVERIERLIDLLIVSATVNAAVGCIDWAGLHIAPYPADAGRSAGLTLHPNYLALTCTIAVPLALLWVARGGRWRGFGVVAIGLLLAGTYVSGSRAGTVSALLALTVTVALIPRLRRALAFVVPVIGMALVAALAFTNAGQQALEQVRLSGADTSGSDFSRALVRDVALEQIEARPVQGVGFGVIGDAHNIYLQLLASGGLIAMAAFLTFVGGLFNSARHARAGPQPDAVAAVAVSIGMWLLNGLFDNQVADKYLYVIPGLLVAMSCVAAASARAPEVPRVRRAVAPVASGRTLAGSPAAGPGS